MVRTYVQDDCTPRLPTFFFAARGKVKSHGFRERQRTFRTIKKKKSLPVGVAILGLSTSWGSVDCGGDKSPGVRQRLSETLSSGLDSADTWSVDELRTAHRLLPMETAEELFHRSQLSCALSLPAARLICSLDGTFRASGCRRAGPHGARKLSKPGGLFVRSTDGPDLWHGLAECRVWQLARCRHRHHVPPLNVASGRLGCL